MVKISKEVKEMNDEQQEKDKQFIKSFNNIFSVEKLVNLWEEEQKVKLEYLNIKFGKYQPKNYKLNREEYIKCYPKSIEYIKNNIYKSNKDNMFYIISVNKDGVKIPVEYTNQEMTQKLEYFGDDLKHWFKTMYYDEYTIDTSITQPKIYNLHGINYLNIFNGYAYEEFKLNEEIYKSRKDDINFIWNHVKHMLCSNNELIFNMVKNFICTLICGKRKLTVCWYIKGARGIGKSSFIRLLQKILGFSNCFTIKDQNEILGLYNGHMLGKTLIYIDDVEFTGQNFLSFGEKMKTNITESELSYRDLYKTSKMFSNISSFIVAGNQDIGALKEVDPTERSRYIMSDCYSKLQNEEYYKRFNKLIDDNEFIMCFYMDCLKNFNKDWNEQIEIKQLPITQTKKEIIQKALTPFIRMIKYYIVEMKCDDLFDYMTYTHFYKEFYLSWHNEQNQDKKIIDKLEMLNEIKNKYDDFITYHEQKRINKNPTKNVIKIDKDKLLYVFTKKCYIVDSDDIEIKKYEPMDELEMKTKEEEKLKKQLKKIEEEKIVLFNKIFELQNKKVEQTEEIKQVILKAVEEIPKPQEKKPQPNFDDFYCDDEPDFEIDFL